MEHISQVFPSELRMLAPLRALVRDTCRRVCRGMDEAGLAQLELAVDEAAANIILHAYAGRQDRHFEAVIDAGPDDIAVALLHEGEPFDPERVRPPSFDGSRESGFGLYLIRQAVDECRYFQDEQGRQGIRLVKKSRPGPPQE